MPNRFKCVSWSSNCPRPPESLEAPLLMRCVNTVCTNYQHNRKNGSLCLKPLPLLCQRGNKLVWHVTYAVPSWRWPRSLSLTLYWNRPRVISFVLFEWTSRKMSTGHLFFFFFFFGSASNFWTKQLDAPVFIFGVGSETDEVTVVTFNSFLIFLFNGVFVVLSQRWGRHRSLSLSRCFCVGHSCVM